MACSSLPSARALPFSFAMGALFPAIVGLLPTWWERTARSHQTILAAWQPDPLWVSVLQMSAVAFLDRYLSMSWKNEENAVWWCLVSYSVAALSSATGHLYAIGVMALTSDPLLSMKRVYVPDLFTGPPGPLSMLANGTWLFLQYDLIIIALSSLSWAYVLVSRLVPTKSRVSSVLPLVLLVGGLVLGPGATVSLALFWRETELKRRRDVSNKGRVSGLASKSL